MRMFKRQRAMEGGNLQNANAARKEHRARDESKTKLNVRA